MVDLRAVIAVLVLVPLLAGCASPADPASTPAAVRPELSAGKGAIQGLLVDDRYRPLHLTDAPKGEFDAKGFILLVETGATLATDTNGVFQAVDLDPGTYTLKPSVEGHEGAPIKVDVTAGQYAEVDLLVRRLLTPGKDTVIVHDDTVLMTCSVQVLDGHFTLGTNCYGDLAGDGSTNWIEYNYTQYGHIAAVVVEVDFSRVGDYEVWLCPHGNLVSDLYSKEVVYGTDHLRYAMVNGSEEGHHQTLPFDPMDLSVWVNVDGPGTQQTDQLTGIPMGATFTFVVKARLVVSAFLELPANLDTYAVLG